MVEIRIANRKDISSLVDMARTSFLEAFTAQNKPENVKAYLEEAFTEEQFLEEMEEPSSTFYIAHVEGKLVAYTKLNLIPAQTDVHDPESLEVARLYVLEEFHGLGIGTILLEMAIHFAKQNGKKYLWLGVWEKNQKAILFYENKGFRRFGQHPFPFGDEVQTDYLMRIDFE